MFEGDTLSKLKPTNIALCIIVYYNLEPALH